MGCSKRLFLVSIISVLVGASVSRCDSSTVDLTLESPHWLMDGVPAPGSATIEKLVNTIIPESCVGRVLGESIQSGLLPAGQ